MAKKQKSLPAATTQAYGTELAFNGLRANHRMRSRQLAGVLAIFTGIFGVHNFYLGKIASGVVELVVTGLFALIFCNRILLWMPYMLIVPCVYAAIRGILLLGMSDAKFREKYRVRTF